MSIFIPEGELWESDIIKKIFSLEHHLELMQKVEAALALAEADTGIIPREAAEDINSKSTLKYIDLAIFDEQMKFTGGHPVVPFLSAWKPSFRGTNHAEFIHYGATTQDILDSALILKLREVYDVIYGELGELKVILREMTDKYRHCPMCGRTHVQHAIPITFGLKSAIWLMEIKRQEERMEDLKKRLFAVSFYGAAGNLASLGDKGLLITEKMSDYLDLDYIPVPWHTGRDSIVEFMTLLVNISTTMGKIGNELYELSRTEVGEVEEPWTYGNVGSSTMPQKRNAFGMESMVGLSKLSQFEVGAIYQANMHEHERDFRAMNIEGFNILMTASMTEKNLHYGILILKGLVVHPEKMRENLDMTKGLIMSESIMMHLAEKMGRLVAHEKIYEYAMSAFSNNTHLKDLILADKEIMNKFTAEEIEKCFDPITYVGDADKMISEALRLAE